MSTRRSIHFLVIVAFLAGGWGLLNHVQSGLGEVQQNLVIRTRFLVQQARGGDSENLSRLAGRYCPPELVASTLPSARASLRAGTRHQAQFERLWAILRDCEPATAAYAEENRPDSERSNSFRQVLVQGKDEHGRPASVRLDWVRVEETWYVQGFKLTASA